MKLASVFLALMIVCGSAMAVEKPMTGSSARFSANNELLLPTNYRNWVAIPSSIAGLPTHQRKQMTSKLYVEPVSYEHFKKTGSWPNRTVIVMELHSGKPVAKGACDVLGFEAAVKDESQFPDPWSYYGIVYDRPKSQGEAKLTANEDPSLDATLAMAFPTLRAVINAKPSRMSPGLF